MMCRCVDRVRVCIGVSEYLEVYADMLIYVCRCLPVLCGSGCGPGLVCVCVCVCACVCMQG